MEHNDSTSPCISFTLRGRVEHNDMLLKNIISIQVVLSRKVVCMLSKYHHCTGGVAYLHEMSSQILFEPNFGVHEILPHENYPLYSIPYSTTSEDHFNH